MCSKYADTAEQVYLPGDFPGATPKRAHVIKECGDQTLICWIEYPNTGATQSVPSLRVCTNPAAARRA